MHLAAAQVDGLLAYLTQHGIAATCCDDTLTRVTLPGIREGQLYNLLGVLHAAETDLGISGLTLQE